LRRPEGSGDALDLPAELRLHGPGGRTQARGRALPRRQRHLGRLRRAGDLRHLERRSSHPSAQGRLRRLLRVDRAGRSPRQSRGREAGFDLRQGRAESAHGGARGRSAHHAAVDGAYPRGGDARDAGLTGADEVDAARPRPVRLLHVAAVLARRVLSTFFWTFLVVSSLLLFPVALLLWAVTAPFDRRRVLQHQFTCFWASLYTWLNPAWPVTIVNRERIRRDATYVMVANHQ